MKFNLTVLALSTANADFFHSLPAHLPMPPHLRKAEKPQPARVNAPSFLKSDQTTKIEEVNEISVNESSDQTSILYEDEPVRGHFDLEAALRDSREKGYGNGVRLRFNGVSKSSLDPIYLCSERPVEQQCCTNKDPHCFTPGGCFCDASCKAFDDCCPDYEELCVDRSCLEKKGDPVKTYFRSIRFGQPKNGTDTNRLPSGGGQPGHVEPDACCGGRPYNHETRCCCNEQITDQCPCQAN